MDPAHAAHGIVTIDTGFQRPRFDAAYLIVENGRAAFVDCGTRHALPALFAALEAQGLGAEAVDWVILTHVHLDHAGGAGALMRELPHARLLVHPRGAAHMVDPARLVAGATAVYGEAEMARSYGEVVPVPAARVYEAPDGTVVELAGRPLLCADTPGHARHHLCVWDARSRSWFTGDTFGLSYRELDDAQGRPFAIPTTSPVQFEPEPLKASIRALCAREPDAMYLTHYGRIGDAARVGAELIEQVDAMVALARAARDRPDRHAWLVEALAALYAECAAAHGSRAGAAGVRAALAIDIELNAQGLEVWLDREAKRTGG
ncbi:MBL fold metallo-hydrolase [Vulcaniibacterium tengchongense]|uniref:Glyoxylase-like metal-dependent hydrolase (Beta-lactamase superfamily II) n=1 Tax=Vulcaniibacterium tengchongense TaxID=1273429 RepID=A0A3N4W379_9GAMM|nr:MBL fold metallo-hydrolase [Vulcaniibacterium tengchongense]RPE79654.1 glyoxylase-like metal-dependent hydrolase (beta-lactamase superfamily II) [Vulcaniibacterium tengchongense]